MSTELFEIRIKRTRVIGRHHLVRGGFDFRSRTVFHRTEVKQTFLSIHRVLAEPSGFGGLLDGGHVGRDGLRLEFVGKLKNLIDVRQFDFLGRAGRNRGVGHLLRHVVVQHTQTRHGRKTPGRRIELHDDVVKHRRRLPQLVGLLGELLLQEFVDLARRHIRIRQLDVHGLTEQRLAAHETRLGGRVARHFGIRRRRRTKPALNRLARKQILGRLKRLQRLLRILLFPVTFPDIRLSRHLTSRHTNFGIRLQIIAETIKRLIILFLIIINAPRLILQHGHLIFVFGEHLRIKVVIFDGLFIFTQPRTEGGRILQRRLRTRIFRRRGAKRHACLPILGELLDKNFIVTRRFRKYGQTVIVQRNRIHRARGQRPRVFVRIARRQQRHARLDGPAHLRTVFPRHRRIPPCFRRILAARMFVRILLIATRSRFPLLVVLLLLAELVVQSKFIGVQHFLELRHVRRVVRHKRTVALEFLNRLVHLRILFRQTIRLKKVVPRIHRHLGRRRVTCHFQKQRTGFFKVIVVEINLRRLVLRVVRKFRRIVDLCIPLARLDKLQTAFRNRILRIRLLLAILRFGRHGNVRTRLLVRIVLTHQLVIRKNRPVRRILTELTVLVEIKNSLVSLGRLCIIFAEIRHVRIIIHHFIVVRRRREIVQIRFVDFKRQRVVKRVLRVLIRHVIPFTGIRGVLLELVALRLDRFGRRALVMLVSRLDENCHRALNIFGQLCRIRKRLRIQHDFMLIPYNLEFSRIRRNQLVINVVGFFHPSRLAIQPGQTLHHLIDFFIIGRKPRKILARIAGLRRIPHAVRLDKVFHGFLAHIHVALVPALVSLADDFLKLSQRFLGLAKIEITPAHLVHRKRRRRTRRINAHDLLVLLQRRRHVLLDRKRVFRHPQKCFRQILRGRVFAHNPAVLFIRFARIAHFGHVERHVITDLVDLFIIGMILQYIPIQFEHFLARLSPDLLILGLLGHGRILTGLVPLRTKLVGLGQIIIGPKLIITRLLPQHVAETFHQLRFGRIVLVRLLDTTLQFLDGFLLKLDLLGRRCRRRHLVRLISHLRTRPFLLFQRLAFRLLRFGGVLNHRLLLILKGHILRHCNGRCHGERRHHRTQHKAYKSFTHVILLMNHAYTEQVLDAPNRRPVYHAKI